MSVLAHRYIFFKAPLGLRWEGVAGYLLGANDQTKQVRFAPELGGEWLLVPRNGGDPVRISAPPQFIWHYGNAFEDKATGVRPSIVDLLVDLVV
jgi:carotenoid cleavage dioxygenase-like enzyme